MSFGLRRNGRLGGPAAQGRADARGGVHAGGLMAFTKRGAALMIAVCGLAVCSVPSRAESNTLEYAVKAAYLFKFTPFVEWPSSAFAAPTSPFYVCVLGGDPFGTMLDQAVDGHQVGEHPVRVRRLQSAEGASTCHILYFGTARAPVAAAALSKLHGAPVLTVTEQSLGVSGGVVQFVVKDGHVRFTIDAGAAAANRVVISAKLLSLAAAVRTGS
jgi:hypothetical protein